MREILFRGKRLDNGEWVTGGSIIQFLDDGIQSFYMPQFNEKCLCEHDSISDNIERFTDCKFYKINPETVGQYTGLKDKNGDMIFEGDIFKFIAYNRLYVGYVKIKKGNTVICCKGADPFLDYALERHCPQRIGNIYDNPELLQGE